MANKKKLRAFFVLLALVIAVTPFTGIFGADPGASGLSAGEKAAAVLPAQPEDSGAPSDRALAAVPSDDTPAPVQVNVSYPTDDPIDVGPDDPAFTELTERRVADGSGEKFGETYSSLIESVPELLMIGTAQELAQWAADAGDDAGRTVVLTADITLSGTWTPKETFSGVFDGCGYSISGLYMTGSDAGLIATLDGGTVKNLFITDATLGSGGEYKGSVAAVSYGGTVKNVYSDAIILGTGHCGGMIGALLSNSASDELKIEGCWFDGSVTLSGGDAMYAGGMIGDLADGGNDTVRITDCLNSGAISTPYAHAAAMVPSVYTNHLVALRTMNTGAIGVGENYASNHGSAVTSWITSGGSASLTDCYGVEGKSVFNVHSECVSRVSGTMVSVRSDLEAPLSGWGTLNGSLVPAYFADNQTDGESIEFTYFIDSTGAVITGYTGSSANVSVPSRIQGRPVTEIAHSAFAGSELVSVVLPETVTFVGDLAFSECALLESVTLPEGLEYLGNWAFYGCESLGAVTIPSTVTFIGYNTFSGCSSLASVVIPEGVTDIGYKAFSDCSSLASVAIPSTVTEIGAFAFFGCDSLTSVTIPASVTLIGDQAFRSCQLLSEIVVEAGNSAYASVDGVLFDAGLTTIIRYPSYRAAYTYDFPSTVTTVAAGAFWNCRGLTVINVPETVTTIGEAAFCGCVNLKSVSLPETLSRIEHFTFHSCKNLTELYIPSGVNFIGNLAFTSCERLETLSFYDSIRSIGSGAFYNCPALETVRFFGTVDGWEQIEIGIRNSGLDNASVEFVTLDVERISIETLPTTVKYRLGESLRTAGLTVRVFYNDRSSRVISTGFAVSGFSSANYGPRKLTVSYGGKTAQFEVTVVNYSVSSIVINTAPTKLNYSDGSQFDPAGLTLKVTYSDGSTAYVSSGFKCEKFSYSAAAGSSLVVSYGGKATQVSIISTSAQLIKWAAAGACANETVFLTNNISVSGTWTPRASFTGLFDGLGYNLSSGVTSLTGSSKGLFKSTSAISGAVVRNLKIGGSSVSNGSSPSVTLSSLTLLSGPSKTSYLVGESFDASGISLKAVLSSGTTQTLTNGFVVSGFDSSTPGAKTVTLRYFSKTVSVTVNVSAAVKVSLGIVNRPHKLAYELGETLDTSGMALRLVWSDGSYETVEAGYMVSGFDSRSVGQKQLIVSYAGFDAAFRVSVGEPSLAEVRITGKPTKTEYLVGDSFDASGIVLTLIYTNGATEEITSGYAVSGFDTSVAGSCTVSLVFGELSAEYYVTVSSPSAITEIGTYAELVSWAKSSDKFQGKTVVLTADITADAGSKWTAKSDFRGVFDGRGHSISGLSATGSNIGLVKTLYGTVKNLYIFNSTFAGSASSYTKGSVAAESRGGTLINVYSNASITGRTLVGGLIGKLGSGTTYVVSCWFDGTVTATANETYASGIIGSHAGYGAVMRDCLNTGTVDSINYAAGISGSVFAANLTAIRCVNAGTVSGNASAVVDAVGSDNGAEGSVSFTDCYGVKGKTGSIGVRQVAGSGNAGNGGTVNGTVAQIAYLSSLSQNDAFYDWSFTPNGLFVPGYFASLDNGKFLIFSYDDLVAWATNGSNDAGRTVTLECDIVANSGNAASFEAVAPANVWVNKNFAGTFEGQGHTISGLYASGANIGFVRTLSGTIRNLYIVNSAFVGGDGNKGAFASNSSGGTLLNVYSDALIKGGNNLGGIVGNLGSGTTTVTSAWFNGNIVSSGIYASGIIGNQQSNPAVVTDCLNTGAVSAASVPAGISGAVYHGTLTATRCVNAGNITGGNGSAIADTVGETDGRPGTVTLVNCYGVFGMSYTLQVRQVRAAGTNGSGGVVNGTVGTLNSLSDLANVAAFSGLWDSWTIKARGLYVPVYFKDFNYTRPAFESLAIDSLPAKTSYEYGESFDPTGLRLRLNFSDGSEVTISDGYTLSAFDGYTLGTQTISASYGGKSVRFNAVVNAPHTVAMSVAVMPEKTLYELEEELDTTGLTLTVNYSDGSVISVTEGFTVTGFDSSEAGTKTLTVTYGDISCQFDVTVRNPVPVSITINTLPAKLAYDKGEEFDATGLVIDLNYSNGSFETIYSGFTVSGYDSNGARTQQITVTYSGFATQFEVALDNYIFGDLNNDGVVNMKDSLLFKMYFAGMKPAMNFKAADVLFDGVIDENDAVLLRQFLAGWTVSLGF